MGNLVAKKTYIEQVLVGAAPAVVFAITDTVILKSMRIYIRNSGGAALTAAVLEGSNDKGVSWVTIDGSGITTAFASLASLGAASIFEDNLYYDSIRLTLTSTAGTKIVVNLTLNNNE